MTTLKMFENPKIALYDAPKAIGDYAIKHKLPYKDTVDILAIIFEMADNNTFLFSDDMWAAVGKSTIAYINVQDSYLNEIISVLKARREPVKIAHESIIAISDALYVMKQAPRSSETSLQRNAPPPYEFLHQ